MVVMRTLPVLGPSSKSAVRMRVHAVPTVAHLDLYGKAEPFVRLIIAIF